MPDVESFNLRAECYQCDSVFLIKVIASEYKDWQTGMLIQDAMPNLSRDDCELIISHTCGVCFDNLMKETDEASESFKEWWNNNLH